MATAEEVLLTLETRHLKVLAALNRVPKTTAEVIDVMYAREVLEHERHPLTTRQPLRHGGASVSGRLSGLAERGYVERHAPVARPSAHPGGGLRWGKVTWSSTRNGQHLVDLARGQRGGRPGQPWKGKKPGEAAP